MRVRLSFDPTNEQQGIEIHNSRLLITTIGAWVRDTFLVDFEKDFSLLPFSTSALANARAEGRKADEKQMKSQLTRDKIMIDKKKANLKIKQIRTQLQKKTAQLKAKGRVGGNTQDYNT